MPPKKILDIKKKGEVIQPIQKLAPISDSDVKIITNSIIEQQTEAESDIEIIEKPIVDKTIPESISYPNEGKKTHRTDELQKDVPEVADVSEVPDESEVLIDIALTNKIVNHGKAKKTIKKSQLDLTKLGTSSIAIDYINADYKFVMTNYDFTKNKSRPIITKYEKALLISKRAEQIESGANPNVKVLAGQGSIEIAEEELRQRLIPLMIVRPIGNKCELWKPEHMEVNMN